MDFLAILMLFLGLALVIAEIFIPSGGMISVLAVICVGIAIWAAHRAWWESDPALFWSYIAAFVLLLPTTIGGSFFLLQRTPLGRRILLEAPSLDEVTPYVDEQEQLKQLVGQRGKTITLLNPGGMVNVAGERFHCECQGMLIDPGEDVQIVGVKGNRLVVRLAKEPPRPTDEQVAGADDATDDNLADDFPDESDSRDEPPLDFDVPQS